MTHKGNCHLFIFFYLRRVFKGKRLGYSIIHMKTIQSMYSETRTSVKSLSREIKEFTVKADFHQVTTKAVFVFICNE